MRSSPRPALDPRVAVRRSRIHGYGLFATEPIRKGELFSIVPGGTGTDSWVLMTDDEFAAYTRTVDSWDAVYLGDGMHRVSTLTRDENPENYGNHSCDPNSAVRGSGRVAVNDIPAGSEITVDYALLSPRTWEMECRCGASNCRHIVRGRL